MISSFSEDPKKSFDMYPTKEDSSWTCSLIYSSINFWIRVKSSWNLMQSLQAWKKNSLPVLLIFIPFFVVPVGFYRAVIKVWLENILGEIVLGINYVIASLCVPWKFKRYAYLSMSRRLFSKANSSEKWRNFSVWSLIVRF